MRLKYLLLVWVRSIPELSHGLNDTIIFIVNTLIQEGGVYVQTILLYLY